MQERINELQKENTELNETIEANLRVHKATEKVDAERIWKLQKENAELHECLNEAIVYLRGHANTYKCERDCKDCELACKGRKWRTALEGGNHAND